MATFKDCEIIVEQIMEIEPYTRDSLNALISAVYKKLVGEEFIRQFDFCKFLKYIDEQSNIGTLPALSTIIRNKSRVQNRRIDLRGNNYEENRRNAEKVRRDLGYGK